MQVDSSITVRVLTLNCWGIVFVSKDRRARMTAIAKHLSRANLDFVCLQEVWSVGDYKFISKRAQTSLPFSHYFNSGVNGPGLCVLSKYPIVDVYFHQWPINGYAHKIHQGDWFGGKGVGLCRIQMNDKIINLYTTHLHAEYDVRSLDYLNHRILQAFDTSQFVKLTSRDCDLAILAGDLNSEPHDPAISLLLLNAQLTDCFDAAQKKSDGCIGTNESFRNSYAPTKELKRQPEGKRIDYVMLKSAASLKVNVLEYVFPLPDRVPGCQFSYSDHEAVEVVLQCFPHDPKAGGDNSDSVDNVETSKKLETVLRKSVDICNDSLHKLMISKKKYLIATVLLAIILLASLFVELFFYMPTETVGLTASVVCYNLLKIIITAAFLFTIFMATIWNRMEQSAILTGKYSMKLLLRKLTEPTPFVES